MSESHFHFCLSGTVSEVDGQSYLLTEEDSRFKIKQAPREIPPGRKTLKVIIREADQRMKVGQLWQVKATLQENALVLVEAEPCEPSS